MEFYKHQQKIINDNPLKKGLFLGTGAGKTRTAVALATGPTLVVCPKTQFLDNMWNKEWELQGKQNSLYVMSKEQFKKMPAPADIETLLILWIRPNPCS